MHYWSSIYSTVGRLIKSATFHHLKKKRECLSWQWYSDVCLQCCQLHQKAGQDAQSTSSFVSNATGGDRVEIYKSLYFPICFLIFLFFFVMVLFFLCILIVISPPVIITLSSFSSFIHFSFRFISTLFHVFKWSFFFSFYYFLDECILVVVLPSFLLFPVFFSLYFHFIYFLVFVSTSYPSFSLFFRYIILSYTFQFCIPLFFFFFSILRFIIISYTFQPLYLLLILTASSSSSFLYLFLPYSLYPFPQRPVYPAPPDLCPPVFVLPPGAGVQEVGSLLSSFGGSTGSGGLTVFWRVNLRKRKMGERGQLKFSRVYQFIVIF